MKSLEEIIREVLEETPQTNITKDTSLRNDLGFDSFKLAQLTVEIEDEYDVDIFDEGNVDTVGEIQQIIDGAA